MTRLSSFARRFGGAVVGALVLGCIATSSVSAMPVQRLEPTQSVGIPEDTLQHVQYSYQQYRSSQRVARYRHFERHRQIQHDQQVQHYRRWERGQQIRHDQGVWRHRAWEFHRRHYGY